MRTAQKPGGTCCASSNLPAPLKRGDCAPITTPLAVYIKRPEMLHQMGRPALMKVLHDAFNRIRELEKTAKPSKTIWHG